MPTYAGIGSRETPEPILIRMRLLGTILAMSEWTLRSGGAPGADSAFERGARDVGGPTPQIFLPWPGFEGRRGDGVYDQPQREAFEVAATYHPGWKHLGAAGRAFHARNVHQVLGPDVTRPDPAAFVVCWTKGGKGGGGTGQAIRIARGYDVPVYDLAVPGGLSPSVLREILRRCQTTVRSSPS